MQDGRSEVVAIDIGKALLFLFDGARARPARHLSPLSDQNDNRST